MFKNKLEDKEYVKTYKKACKNDIAWWKSYESKMKKKTSDKNTRKDYVFGCTPFGD